MTRSAFNPAVDDVAAAARRLFDSMAATRPPRDREVEAMKAKERARERFG
jgi:hypothetical protein